MKLVIDANVVFSALIAGNLTDVILSSKLDLIAPEHLFEEIRNNREEVKEKSKLNDTEFEILLTLLEKKIQLVPFEEFTDTWPRAIELLHDHVKDAPYVALALKLDCSFWTYEKRLAELPMSTKTTKDIREHVNK